MRPFAGGMARMGVLVLAAAREELGDLPGEVVGVGALSAGIRAARLLERRPVDGVVLIGSAGAYPGGPAVGTAVASGRLGWSSGVAAMGLGYVPRPLDTLDGHPDLLGALDLQIHDILTVGAISTDPIFVQRLSDGWTVEHLEAFGVAWACHGVGVPFVAVLGIANEVGPDAHVQWLTHRDEAHQAARRGIAPLLS